MRKRPFFLRSMIFNGSVGLILFASLLLQGCSVNDVEELHQKETPLAPPTIKLDLDFEKEDDLNWIKLFKPGEDESLEKQDALLDGTIRLGDESAFATMDMIYELEADHFLHIRVKSGGEICGSDNLINHSNEFGKAIRFESCSDNRYHVAMLEYTSNSGDNIGAYLPASGSVPAIEDEWIDEIFWINESGDQIYYFVTMPEYPGMVMYGAVALKEEWKGDRWGVVLDAYFEQDENGLAKGYRDIEMIRVGKGNIKTYLTYFVPAYEENKEELDAFFENPVEPMPELVANPQMEDEQPVGEQEVSNEIVQEEQVEIQPEDETADVQEEMPQEEILEDNVITERIGQELERVIQMDGIIPQEYEITDIYQARESDDWPDGYCLKIDYIGELLSDEEFYTDGEICFFQDRRESYSEIVRMDHYKLNSWNAPLPSDEPIGHYSLVNVDQIPGEGEDVDGARLEYRGSFIQDAWIGDFHLPQLPIVNDYLQYVEMINNILNNLPESFASDPVNAQFTETQRDIYEVLFEQFNRISDRFGLHGHTYQTDTWMGAEVSYCYAMYDTDGMEIDLCLFRDGAENQPSDLRLQQMWDVFWWRGDIIGEDILEDADDSILSANEDSPSSFSVPFIKDEWVGYFNFHISDEQPHYDAFNMLASDVFLALDSLPEDLALQKTDLLYNDILENTWYDLPLPEGYRLGPVHGSRDPMQCIFYQNERAGEIYYSEQLDYLTRSAEKSFDSDYFNNDYGHLTGSSYNEYTSDPDVLSVSTQSDPDYKSFVTYDMGTNGLIANIRMYKKEIQASIEIGQVISAALEETREKQFFILDKEVEETIWGCFPADDEMLLSDFMPAYVRSVQYSDEGYFYRMNYLDLNQPVAQTKIVYYAFPFQPSRVDLLNQGSSLGYMPYDDRHIYFVFAEGNAFDEDIQVSLSAFAAQNMVEFSSKIQDLSIKGKYFPYAWLNDPENTYVEEIYTPLATEMMNCLGEKTNIDFITVPGEINEEVLDESYVRELLVLSDEGSSSDQPKSGSGYLLDDDVPYLNVCNWQAHGIYLELWFSRELTEPLTYAFYSPKYDTVMYLQQNKYVLKGDRIYTRLTVERDWLFEGDYVLLIWSGDTLIAYRPFVLFSDRGAM